MATDTGKLVRVKANSKGTGNRRTPTAMALKAKGKAMPAAGNPDGNRNRPGQNKAR